MKTTIDIPDELYRELKVRAAKEGVAVRQIVLRGLAHELEPAAARPIRKLKLPLVPSSRPGTLNLTNQEIDDILFS
jgi:plasmid stability protein